jgi:hypothetical protein
MPWDDIDAFMRASMPPLTGLVLENGAPSETTKRAAG